MATMFIMMNEARLLCGVQGESQANLAYELSKQYASERVQFGHEIMHHPDVKKNLLKMRAVSRGLRQLVLYTAHLFDLEKTDHKFADLIGLMTPICKAFSTDMGLQVSCDAVQIHGGYGFCKEYGVEQFVRDTIIGRIYEGTNGIQAMDFLMRKIMKDQGKTWSWLAEMMLGKVNELGDEFKVEKDIYARSLMEVNEVVKKFFTEISAKNSQYVLYNSADFLTACSHLVVGWQLAQSAAEAKKQLAQASGSKKTFLETKVDDFKIYTYHFVVNIFSLTQSMKVTQLSNNFPV
jgi:hypothetical protein